MNMPLILKLTSQLMRMKKLEHRSNIFLEKSQFDVMSYYPDLLRTYIVDVY